MRQRTVSFNLDEKLICKSPFNTVSEQRWIRSQVEKICQCSSMSRMRYKMMHFFKKNKLYIYDKDMI